MNNEFYDILTEIAYGLKEKSREVEKRRTNEKSYKYKYVKSNYLIRAINKLSVFALKNDIYDENLIPQHETVAILEFFSKPISWWIKNLQDKLGEDFLNFYGSEEGALITLYGENQYQVTELCNDLADDCILYNRDSEQYKLFRKMKKLKIQEQYVFLRKFIIENPIIENYKFYELLESLKRLGIEESKGKEFINLAYEKIPNDVVSICGYCSWTVSKSMEGVEKCIDGRCKKKTNKFTNVLEIDDIRMSLRLRPGVMRFVALPGFLELEIIRFCEDNKLRYELWPNKDAYDVRVIDSSGKIIAIDAKDYRNAFTLANNLLSKGDLFRGIEYDNAYIVLPSEARENRYDYCTVVNKAIAKINRKARCITISELFNKLREV